jgi:hypothetical protein
LPSLPAGRVLSGAVAAYDAAVSTLYQAPFGDFVAERKRLSAELKGSGDKEGAARLAKLQRPPVSAWAVNQLWWRRRDAFEALLEAAGRVKVGEREAAVAHRQALGQLREEAAELLREAGNAATETTLRRVATTLSAVAAQGGFEPDPPGMLSADRDPPGFETLGFGAGASAGASAKTETAPPKDAAAQRKAEAEQRRAEEEERQRRAKERERLSAALREARALHGARQREIRRLKEQLENAEREAKETEAEVARIESELASL